MIGSYSSFDGDGLRETRGLIAGSPCRSRGTPKGPCPSPVILDGYQMTRCSRHNDHGWRCPFDAVPGYMECDRHKRMSAESQRRRRANPGTREKINAKKREWTRQNPDAIRRYASIYIEGHREYVQDYQRKWREKNRIAIAKQALRRTEKRVPGVVARREIRRAIARAGCAVCGMPFEPRMQGNIKLYCSVKCHDEAQLIKRKRKE